MSAATAQPGTSADVCTPPTPCAHEDAAKAIAAMRKRLSKWELDHLRTLCAELDDRLNVALERIDQLESEVSRAWDAAESWRTDAMELANDLQHEGKTVGLTQAGHLVVVEAQGGAA